MGFPKHATNYPKIIKTLTPSNVSKNDLNLRIDEREADDPDGVVAENDEDERQVQNSKLTIFKKHSLKLSDKKYEFVNVIFLLFNSVL